MLDFHDNAIILSGVTGTKLKSKILGEYYKLWWAITSKGNIHHYSGSTAIIEMNAATGEVYLDDSNKTILGSSGHALQLKGDNPASELNVFLVEDDDECFEKLQNVIQERWPSIDYSFYSNTMDDVGLYLFRNSNEVIDILNRYKIGISLFFFDPLLYTKWSEIESVAERRIKKYYQIGTEFLIFTFTSDWFTGRRGLHPLPTHTDSSKWSKKELCSVQKCDEFFGNSSWQSSLLCSKSLNETMKLLVELYKEKLQSWFRYVLPMPFEPKLGQMYHIFVCSNYEAGVNITKKFYTDFTGNPSFSPNNSLAYKKFLKEHPEKKMAGNLRSNEWKILWNVIRNHHDGLCDIACKELSDKQPDGELRNNTLEWLASQGYLKKVPSFPNIWNNSPQLYQIDWTVIKKVFEITQPEELIPLKPSTMNN